MDKEKIEGTLHSDWVARSVNALAAEKVREHIAAEEEYFAELKPDVGGSGKVDRDVKAK